MSLRTPSETVEKLQTSLQTKAKPDPAFRFYALWDKVCRKNGLREAYRRCSTNAGAAGVDSETYERIDTHGLERWLETLWEGHRQLERTPGRGEAIFLRDELGRCADLGDLAPSRKGSLARSAAEVGRDGFGIRDVEEVRDLIVNREKPLCLAG